MKLSTLYETIERIGVMSFSTIHNGEVHSRSAHFNGCDEDGLYFRTMVNKPYFRQLCETGKLTVCGISNSTVQHLDNGGVYFPPSVTLRLIGEVRRVAPETIIEKAKTNERLQTAANDIVKYPSMADGNFVMYRAKGELYDADFEMEHRDHKLLRTRFSFGGASFNPAGVHITERCIECGACEEACSFNAIAKSSPYRCISERCDDCGSCIRVCPACAIDESLPF